jgi:guanylate kinase
VYQSLQTGQSVILEIEVEGAKKVRDQAPTVRYRP